MKVSLKIISCFLLAAILLSACSSTTSTSVVSSKDEEGHSVQTTDRGTTVFYDELPCKVEYNDGIFTLTDLQFYEDQGDDYNYVLFAVASIDLSSLTDEQIHWLREEDLDVHAYATQEKNDLDFSSLSKLGSLYLTDTKIMNIVFMSSTFHSYRHSFSGTEVSAVVDARQEETYDYTSKDTGKVSKLHKQYSVHYQAIIPENLPSANTIDSSLAAYILKWLKAKGELWEGLIQSSKN